MNASADNVVSPAVAEVNSLVDKGLRALDEFLKLDQEQIDFIVAKASIAALDKHGVLAMHAVEETCAMRRLRPVRRKTVSSGLKSRLWKALPR